MLKADQDECHTLRRKYQQQHFSAEVSERGRHGCANRLFRSPVKPHNEPHDEEEEHEMNIKPVEQRRPHQGRLRVLFQYKQS